MVFCQYPLINYLCYNGNILVYVQFLWAGKQSSFGTELVQGDYHYINVVPIHILSMSCMKKQEKQYSMKKKRTQRFSTVLWSKNVNKIKV